RVGITQDLPAPGKLSLRRQVAEQEAEAAQLDVGEAALQLSGEVKQGWWRVFFLDRALEIVRRNQDVLRQTVKVAETRYRVGEGLQQDVLLAQLELSKLLEMEIEWVGERRTAEARLNTLLYRSPATPIILPTSAEGALPAVPAGEILIQQAQKDRPALTAQRQQVAAAESQLGLARRDYWPDFSVGANHEWWPGEKDSTSVMFAMSLPLHSGTRQDRAVDQRGAELMAQRYALQEAEAQVAAEVAVALSDYQRARHHTELYKTSLLPQAAQTVAAMVAGYQVGKVDFLNLAQAQMTLNDYETRYWQSLSEAQEALARLSAAVGKEISHE
nr:TolC family protein [Ktedonobacterales bacterium]